MPVIRVRYFAMLRDLRDPGGEEELSRPDGERVAELYAALFPSLTSAGQRLPVAIAVNQAYVSGDYVPAEGDEVAFIPPVGGGA
jgi:molybdopterin converting factor small subunit